MTDANIGHLLEEKKEGEYTPLPKNRLKLAEGLMELVYDVYGGRNDLIKHVDEWIKLVTLHTDREIQTGNQVYFDLLFFLFTFKDVLQITNKQGNLVDELPDFVYSVFGRKHLIKQVDKWTQFVALCTEKEHQTGSEDYLELLNFLFIFKEALQKKK